MDEFKEPLRRHYQNQSLGADRAAAILSAGRAAAARHKRRRSWLLGVAAAAMLGLGILAALNLRKTQAGPSASPSVLTTADISRAVMDFFAQPEHSLARVSTDLTSLQEWLASQGVPSFVDLPATIARLESFGCHVLEVRGEQVSLLCFFLNDSPIAATGAMPGKPQKEPASSAPAMSKPRQLVHLLAAPRSAFREAPQPGEHVRLQPSGDWKFVSWADDELVYVAATIAPEDSLTALFSAL